MAGSEPHKGEQAEVKMDNGDHGAEHGRPAKKDGTALPSPRSISLPPSMAGRRGRPRGRLRRFEMALNTPFMVNDSATQSEPGTVDEVVSSMQLPDSTYQAAFFSRPQTPQSVPEKPSGDSPSVQAVAAEGQPELRIPDDDNGQDDSLVQHLEETVARLKEEKSELYDVIASINVSFSAAVESDPALRAALENKTDASSAKPPQALLHGSLESPDLIGHVVSLLKQFAAERQQARHRQAKRRARTAAKSSSGLGAAPETPSRLTMADASDAMKTQNLVWLSEAVKGAGPAKLDNPDDGEAGEEEGKDENDDNREWFSDSSIDDAEDSHGAQSRKKNHQAEDDDASFMDRLTQSLLADASSLKNPADTSTAPVDRGLSSRNMRTVQKYKDTLAALTDERDSAVHLAEDAAYAKDIAEARLKQCEDQNEQLRAFLGSLVQNEWTAHQDEEPEAEAELHPDEEGGPTGQREPGRALESPTPGRPKTARRSRLSQLSLLSLKTPKTPKTPYTPKTPWTPWSRNALRTPSIDLLQPENRAQLIRSVEQQLRVASPLQHPSPPRPSRAELAHMYTFRKNRKRLGSGPLWAALDVLLSLLHLVVLRQKANLALVGAWLLAAFVVPGLWRLQAVLGPVLSRVPGRVPGRWLRSTRPPRPPPPFFPRDPLAELLFVYATACVLVCAVAERRLWLDHNADWAGPYLHAHVLQYRRDTDSCHTLPLVSRGLAAAAQHVAGGIPFSPYHWCICVPTLVDPRAAAVPLAHHAAHSLDAARDAAALLAHYAQQALPSLGQTLVHRSGVLLGMLRRHVA